MTAEHADENLAALSTLDDPVRRRLHAWVTGRVSPVGRDEAAAAVGISRALAAYHLDKLAASGLLAASYQRPPGRRGPGAGRPAKVYTSSGRRFAVTVPPTEYELAARVLVDAVAADTAGGSREALYDAARRHGAGIVGGRAAPTGRGRVRPAVCDALRHHGFQPWCDDDGTVRLRNCPFHVLAARRPDIVCGMTLALIEGMVAVFDEDVRPVLDPVPGRCCVAIPDIDGSAADTPGESPADPPVSHGEARHGGRTTA